MESFKIGAKATIVMVIEKPFITLCLSVGLRFFCLYFYLVIYKAKFLPFYILSGCVVTGVELYPDTACWVGLASELIFVTFQDMLCCHEVFHARHNEQISLHMMYHIGSDLPHLTPLLLVLIMGLFEPSLSYHPEFPCIN